MSFKFLMQTLFLHQESTTRRTSDPIVMVLATVALIMNRHALIGASVGELANTTESLTIEGIMNALLNKFVLVV